MSPNSGVWGRLRGDSANELQLGIWSPKKLWRSNSIFDLCCHITWQKSLVFSLYSYSTQDAMACPYSYICHMGRHGTKPSSPISVTIAASLHKMCGNFLFFHMQGDLYVHGIVLRRKHNFLCLTFFYNKADPYNASPNTYSPVLSSVSN